MMCRPRARRIVWPTSNLRAVGTIILLEDVRHGDSTITPKTQTTMKQPKAPTAKQLEKQVTDWNTKFPVGTTVMRYKLIEPLREGTETKTRSEAWVMGGHSAMVMVEGVLGGVILESVCPVC